MKEQLQRSEKLGRSLAHHPRLAKAREVRALAKVATVGILSPNVLVGAFVSLDPSPAYQLTQDYPTVVWACFAAAIPFAPMPSSSTRTELEHLLKISHAKLLFVHPDLVALAVTAGFKREHMILIENRPYWRGATVDRLIERGAAYPDLQQDGEWPSNASGLCYVLFSSGSTGAPKGEPSELACRQLSP